MKDLNKSLKKAADDLMKAAKAIEKIANQLDTKKKPVAKAAKKAAAKKVTKKTTKPPTAADSICKVISRYKKGASLTTIKQKTGFDIKKIQNNVYRLKKQGKIKSEKMGVYIKA